ncbi:MAG: hypothetical protein ACE5FN_07915 [Leptospirillia bacterium]
MRKIWIPAALALLLGAATGCTTKDGMMDDGMHGSTMDDGMKSGMMQDTMKDDMGKDMSGGM